MSPDMAFGGSSSSSRYFTMELLAPPLTPLPTHEQAQDSFQNHLHICYTNNPKVVEEWLRRHVPQAFAAKPRITCIGFDTEAVPFPKAHRFLKTAALVQLSTETNAIVIQLAKASNKPSAACLDILQYRILENPYILKAGCGLEDDMADLFRLYEDVGCSLLQAKSRLELGGVGSQHHGHTVGLKTLTAQVLGLELPKPKRTIRSNWGRVPLSQAQVTYAARDAWAACAVVHQLAQMDPHGFGTLDRIQQRLQRGQPSVRDLVWRRDKRKHAKNMMRFIRHARAHGALNHEQEVQWLQELRQIRRDNQHIHPQRYPLVSSSSSSATTVEGPTEMAPVGALFNGKNRRNKKKKNNLEFPLYNQTGAKLIY